MDAYGIHRCYPGTRHANDFKLPLLEGLETKAHVHTLYLTTSGASLPATLLSLRPEARCRRRAGQLAVGSPGLCPRLSGFTSCASRRLASLDVAPWAAASSPWRFLLPPGEKSAVSHAALGRPGFLLERAALRPCRLKTISSLMREPAWHRPPPAVPTSLCHHPVHVWVPAAPVGWPCWGSRLCPAGPGSCAAWAPSPRARLTGRGAPPCPGHSRPAPRRPGPLPLSDRPPAPASVARWCLLQETARARPSAATGR